MNAPTSEPTQVVQPVVPTAIWMPAVLRAGMPDVYHGTPLEMVQQMAHDMKPGLGVHDAIDLLIRSIADERGLTIDLRAPACVPEPIRATMFVLALLFLGVAEEMPSA